MINEALGWTDIRHNMEPATVDGRVGWTAPIPEGWRQGRTAYGGVTSALMVEAALRTQDGLPPLRSGLINFVGPVTDTPHVSAELLRQGRNVTSMSACARVGDQVVGTASLAFGAARSSAVNVSCRAPEAPAPNDCEPFTPEPIRAMVPQFFHNFDTRLVAGSRPMMGSEGHIRAWSRHGDPASREGLTSLVCLGDVLPPAALPLLRKMAPVSSMTWIFNILSDTPQTEDGWWLVDSKLTAASGGYSSQVMRIWNTAGELVVEGMQSIAIFG